MDGKTDGRTDRLTDGRTESWTPISHLAKAGATKTIHFELLYFNRHCFDYIKWKKIVPYVFLFVCFIYLSLFFLLKKLNRMS